MATEPKFVKFKKQLKSFEVHRQEMKKDPAQRDPRKLMKPRDIIRIRPARTKRIRRDTGCTPRADRGAALRRNQARRAGAETRVGGHRRSRNSAPTRE